MQTLYHGTRATTARRIVTEGFKRGKTASYTGTGINLMPLMTIAQEYGPVQANGAVLQCRLADTAVIVDLDAWRIDDSYFHNHPEVDGVTVCHGNVVVVWNPEVIVVERKLTTAETRAILANELEEGGPDMAYNGATQDEFERYCASRGWAA